MYVNVRVVSSSIDSFMDNGGHPQNPHVTTVCIISARRRRGKFGTDWLAQRSAFSEQTCMAELTSFSGK